MAVHVVIKRKFKMNQPERLMPLLREISSRAREQPGYISSVTLRSTEDERWNGLAAVAFLSSVPRLPIGPCRHMLG